MARKHRSRPKGRRAEWSALETGALLSWLDHTLKYEGLDFENTAVPHLHQVYNLPQINRKLASLWATHGPERKHGFPKSTWKDDLFAFGSECLNGLDDDILEARARGSEALEEEYHSTQIQITTRRLRSASRQTDLLFGPRHVAVTPAKKARSPYKQRVRPPSQSLTPSAVKREIDSPAKKESSARKKRRKLSEQPNLTPSIRPQRKSPIRRRKVFQILQRPETAAANTVEDSEDDLSEILSEDLENYGKPRDVTRCICGAIEESQPPPGLTEVDTSYCWVVCEDCEAWQHQLCADASLGRDTVPEDYLYFCERCKFDIHENVRNRRLSSHTADERPVLPNEQTSKNFSPKQTIPLDTLQLPTSSSTAAEISAFASDPRLENAREKIKDLEEELLELKLDLSVTEGSVAALESQVSSLRTAQRQRDKQAGFPIEELIEQNLDLRKTSLAALKNRDEGSNFTRLTATSREWFGTTKVDQGFCDIYGQSRQTLCRRDNEALPFIPSLARHDKLRQLVGRCLDIPMEDEIRMQNEICKLSKSGLEAVVRALITSALVEWVFETDWPRFDDGPSEVLSKYRELLAMQDGVVTLRNLDLAVRTTLTKGTIFRELKIPNTAKDLAIELSQTLAPLFSDTPDLVSESDWDGFATWHDDKEEWMDRRKRFTQMFKFALETKADSCLNIQDYEMLIYPPGTMFDKRTMKVETSTRVKNPGGNHEGRVVELCLEAAVFAHNRKVLGEDASAAEAAISSRNFLRKKRKDRAGIEAAVKAIVVLSEEL